MQKVNDEKQAPVPAEVEAGFNDLDAALEKIFNIFKEHKFNGTICIVNTAGDAVLSRHEMFLEGGLSRLQYLENHHTFGIHFDKKEGESDLDYQKSMAFTHQMMKCILSFIKDIYPVTLGVTKQMDELTKPAAGHGLLLPPGMDDNGNKKIIH